MTKIIFIATTLLLAACQHTATEPLEIRYQAQNNIASEWQQYQADKKPKTIYQNTEHNFKIDVLPTQKVSFKEFTDEDFSLILCFDEQAETCSEGLDSWTMVKVKTYPQLAKKITANTEQDLYSEINKAYPQTKPLTHEVLSENLNPNLQEINGQQWYVTTEKDSHGEYTVYHLIVADKLYIISMGKQRPLEYQNKVLAAFALMN